jgi:hypothetical protein
MSHERSKPKREKKRPKKEKLMAARPATRDAEILQHVAQHPREPEERRS